MVIFIGKSLISLRVLILESQPLVLRTSCIEKITNPEEFDMYCHRSVTKAYTITIGQIIGTQAL